jgi:transcriptional regulator with XRE-family HTH domain
MNKPDIVYKRKSRQDFLKDVVGDLVDLRHKRGMTQEEVNHKIGVADRLVSKWECGIRTPTSFNLYCWADALDGKLTVEPNRDRPPKSSSDNYGRVDYTDADGEEAIERMLVMAA